MKIMLLNEEDKWVEVENGLDFDTFYEDVVLKERPFKFADCTNGEKARFLNYLSDKSGGLDDYKYYLFDVGDNNSVENVFVFDDLKLYTLENVIREHEAILDYYKGFIRRILKANEEDGLLTQKFDVRIYDENENEIELWLITVKGADKKEIQKNLLNTIEKKWNENHEGVPFPTEYLSYCRTW